MKDFGVGFGEVGSAEDSGACKDGNSGGAVAGQAKKGGMCWGRNDGRCGVFCRIGREVDSGLGTFEAEGLGMVDLVGEEADRDCCGEREVGEPVDTAEDNRSSCRKDEQSEEDISVELSSCEVVGTCTWES